MPINPVMPDNAPIEATEYEEGSPHPPEPSPEQTPEPPPPPVREPEPPAPPREEPEADPEPDDDDDRPEADTASEAGKALAARKHGLEGRKLKIQEQINALVRERGEVSRETEKGRQERAELLREIEALRAEKTERAPARRPEQVDPRDPKPVEAQYDDYAAYTEAVARWGARQEYRQAEQVRHQQQERMSRQQWETTRQKSYSERYQAFAKTNPSFEQEINRDDLLLSAPMVDVVKDSPVGPQILLHLARNSDEVDRIGALHPVLAYGEMKKIEARLEGAHSGSPQQTAQHSKAPAPIKPVGNVASRRSDSDEIPGEDVSEDEHFERMNRRDEMLRKRGINTRRGYGVRV